MASFASFWQQGECGSEAEEGEEVALLSLVLAGLDAGAGDSCCEVPGAEPPEGARRSSRPCPPEPSPVAACVVRAGTDDGYREDQPLERLTGVQIRPGHRDGRRERPWASASTCSVLPFLPDRPDWAPSANPSFRPHRRGIDDRGRPVQFTSGTGIIQHRPVQATPQSRPRPRREPAVCSGRRDPEGLRQLPPRAPARQHVHHGREHNPLIHRGRTAALPTGLERRQQRCGQLPQPVRNKPTRQINPHGTASCRTTDRHVRHSLVLMSYTAC